MGLPSARLAPLMTLAVSLTTSAAELKTFGEPGELPRLETGQGGQKVTLPLRHTAVEAEISGFVARVEVTQRYQNPFPEPIEVHYVFPLPERAAVDSFRLVVQDRAIDGVIKRKTEAREDYQRAKRAGRTAALLEQERANLFTQSIANIPPGETIEVQSRYVQLLGYDSGEYEFVFPMVVLPRYQPRSAEGGASAPSSPPVLPLGLRSGHDISIHVTLRPGLPVVDFDVPTHEVSGVEMDDRLELRLSERDSVPNRDFILRYRVAGPTVRTATLAHRTERGGFFALAFQPPALDVDQRVGRRELIFVVDVSGSMSGLPLWLCQEAMREALLRLRPVDTFNVITFSGGSERLFKTAQRASEEHIAAAQALINRMSSGGGTEMLDAVTSALTPSSEEGRHRYVFFLTDGQVGNSDAIHAATRKHVSALDSRGHRARVFAYGAGSTVNRELLEGLAEAGNGLAFYASNREDPIRGVDRYFRVIDEPVLTDVRIAWGGLDVTDVMPARTPDLFLSRGVVVVGRYGSAGRATVKVVGRGPDGRTVELPFELTLPSQASDNGALTSVWARAKVHELESSLWGHAPGEPDQRLRAVEDEVAQLGLDYRLLTRHTAFVAVDLSRQVGNGEPRLVTQPIDMPEDIDAYAAGATPWVASVGPAEGVRHLPASPSRFDRGGGWGISLDAKGQLASALQTSRLVVAGSLDKSLIRAVIDRHSSEVRSCYELGLLRNWELRGRLVVRLTIDHGSVTDAAVLEDQLDPEVARCVLARARTWRFPVAAGGGMMVINHPWVFSRKRDD